MDQIDRLQQAAEAFERRVGREAASWADLRQAGYLRGNIPSDPTGVVYRLDSGMVTLDRSSRLYPLPVDPARSAR